MSRILIFSEDSRLITFLKQALPEELQVDSFEQADECFRRIGATRYDIVFLDLFSGKNKNGWEGLLHRFWFNCPFAQLVLLARKGDRSLAQEALERNTVAARLDIPIQPGRLKDILNDLRKPASRWPEERPIQDPVLSETLFAVMQTSSPLMKNVLAKVKAVSRTESTVLLTGETGTGKGMLARLLHHLSDRRDKSYVSVQCSAMAETLLESELFGHEKGAFTGAIRQKPGKFELAQGGTLFLDEIGTVSPGTQIRLLQVLEERQFQRVGGEETMYVDVRFLAAANSDLRLLVSQGTFRSDLYYRLNVFPIEVPALRERKEDIPALAKTFIKRLARVYRKEVHSIDPIVLEAFTQYEWPGNIRELENLVERAFILETDEILRAERFPSELFRHNIPVASLNLERSLAEVRAEVVERTERAYLESLLSRNRGRIESSAREAGIGVRQLHKLLHKYQIHKENYR